MTFKKQTSDDNDNGSSGEQQVALFSDDTGEALNEAAFRLVREATKDGPLNTLREEGDGDGDDVQSMKWIETVKIAPGRHKYVLMDVYNERNERKLIVRSYANCGYHADNYRVAMREIQNDGNFSSNSVKARVIGGGRIEYDPVRSDVNVYGYSMTFGRTPGCNKKTMEIIQKTLNIANAQWSDDGY